MWFILIDACSKWPEVVSMTSTTADKTISVLRSIFARCGLPDNIVTDNGPQFTVTEFKQFCDGNGIRHTLIAPYHPSSNGQAERFVQTFKSAMRKGKGEDVQKTLNQFLLHYRTTPHPKTGKTPSEVMFGRNIKTRLDFLHPKEAVRRQATQTTKARNRSLMVEDSVWVRNYQGSPRWLPGEVVTKLGPRNYKVKVRDQIWKRHLDQLRLRQVQVDTKNVIEDFSEFPSDNYISPPAPEVVSGPPERRYPQRSNRRPPDRLNL